MKKYGIAKRGFGKALRQSFGVGGIAVKKIFKKAAKENIEKAKKLTGKSKEKYQTEQEIIKKNKGKPFADMKKSEIAEELNAIKSQKKILEAKDVKEFGDTRPESFKTYKGKKLEGKTWEDRAKQRQKLIEMED
jgi:hypothetical protein